MAKEKKTSKVTGSTREVKYEVGKNKPPVKHRFSSANQPDVEKAKETKRKKKFTREVLREIMNTPYQFAHDSQIKQQLKKAFGDRIRGMSVAEIMSLQQIQKAILKEDTGAFNTLMDQAIGRPVQAIASTDADGNDAKTPILVLPKGITFEFPSNTDGE